LRLYSNALVYSKKESLEIGSFRTEVRPSDDKNSKTTNLCDRMARKAQNIVDLTVQIALLEKPFQL
jgi:hypothetical protein